MKALLVAIAAQFLFLLAKSADSIPGYMITSNGDTVICQIKLRGGWGVPSNGDKVTIVNDKGEDQVYKAKDGLIKAYGYYASGIKIEYTYFELQPKNESGFFRNLVVDDKYKLYFIMESTQSAPVSTSSPKYVLVNPAGIFNYFRTCTICGWKKKMRDLLQDDPKGLEELEKIAAKEIPDFVKKLNAGIF